MNRKQRRMAAAALIVLLLGFVFWLRSRRQAQADRARKRAEEKRRRLEIEAAKRKEEVAYVAPRQDIPARTTITDEMIRVVAIAKEDAPWAENEEDLERYPKSVDQVVGRIALVDLARDEPLRVERLAAKDDLRAISFIIERGRRAVTIPINADKAVGGWLRQGDFVDIMGTVSLPDGSETVTKPIMQRVKIMVVDDTFIREKAQKTEDEDSGGKKKKKGAGPSTPKGVPKGFDSAYRSIGSVTFEVDPVEAEKLILASERIPLHLVLRNRDDEVIIDDPVVIKYGDVTGIKEEEKVAKPKGTVELISGRSRSKIEVGVE